MASETISRKCQRTRKRLPLEVLQGGSPKKVAMEPSRGHQVSPFSEWQASKHNLLRHPRTDSYPESPSPPPPRLKPSTQHSNMPTVTDCPSHSVGSRRSASMATQRHIIRPESQSATAPAFVGRAFNHELGSHQELASSQPVSLIQLCAKPGSSRSKASRNSKAFQTGSLDDMIEAGVGAVPHDKHAPLSRLSLLHHSSTEDYRLSDDTGHLTPPPQFFSQEYPWQRYGARSEDAQGKTWHPSHSDYHTQKNPLSYASYCNHAQSRANSHFSESPFPRKTDQRYPERETWPADMTPLSRKTPIDIPQSNPFTQKIRFLKEYTPASSLQIYRASFDRPHDKSPYESFRLKHRNYRTDLPEISSGLQYGYHPESDYSQYTGNTTIRSEPTLSTHCRERLPDFETTTNKRELQAAHKLQNAPTLGLKSTNGSSASNRILKEEIYAMLDSMSLGPETDSKHTSVSQDTENIKTKSETPFDQQQLENKLESSSLPSVGLGGDNTDSRTRETIFQDFDIGKEGHHKDTIIEEPRFKTSYCEPSMQVSREHGRSSSHPDTPAARIIRPPPGLSGPTYKASSVVSNSLQNIGAVQARLEEANAWFHKDGRGEGQLRQHIANIAENYIIRTEHIRREEFSAKDRIATKQTISLLGDAIANLHSYVSTDRSGQATHFADFRPVEPPYSALPLGGRRSYFDYNPKVHSWRHHMK